MKAGNDSQVHKLRSFLEINPAQQKLVKEIIPRMQNRSGNYTKVVKLDRRRGDNAQEAYIELWGNPIAQYEKEKQVAMIKNG